MPKSNTPLVYAGGFSVGKGGRGPAAELDEFTRYAIAAADERTRFNHAIRSEREVVLYQPYPRGPVYRVRHVRDDSVVEFQRPELDPDPDQHDPRTNYWPVLFRVDFTLTVRPTDDLWTTWMEATGLRRHRYFVALLSE